MNLRGLGTSAAIFAVYVATFGVLALPWLRVASHAAPYSELIHPVDERVVIWILGWVAHALASHPLHVFDSNINFPAPAQLGSIEHFFGTQLLFAIPFRHDGKCGARDERRGIPFLPAGRNRDGPAARLPRLYARHELAGGIVFALGPLRVPADPMTLEVPNFYLPLIALAITTLRLRGTVRAWMALFATVGVLSAAILLSRGTALGTGLDDFAIARHPIYSVVERTARGDGALLDLPFVSLSEALSDPVRTAVASDADAMLASTQHWLPLVTGLTSYAPPHRALVDALIARLPASDALDDLVDMTHVRWIVLHPTEVWPTRSLPTRAALLKLPGITRMASIAGADLLRIDRTQHHPEWFAAIARGIGRDETLLGTPLVPLANAAARALVVPRTALPGQAIAGRPFLLSVAVSNVGSAAWPVSVAAETSDAHGVSHVVRLVSAWRTAGDTVTRDIWLIAPDGPGNVPLRRHFVVVPPVG